MSVLIIDWLVIAAIICAAGILILQFLRPKSLNIKFEKFAKHLKLKTVYNSAEIYSRHNFILLPVDKVIIDEQIVDLCTEIYAMPEKQKIYSMYANQHHKFYSSYIERRWEMAIVIASSLRTAWDGQLSAYYDLMISRCINFKQKPPVGDWNGIVIKG
jgi:uncharacterized membrane protein